MSLDILSLVSRPSLDRPFGIELWPIFDKAFSSIMGYAPTEFEFVEGQTFMSTKTAAAVALIGYYVVIFGGRELMRNRSAMTLKVPFIIHNLYLTIISGALLVLFIEQLLPTLWRHGVFYAICDHDGGWTKQLVILYFVRRDFSIILPQFFFPLFLFLIQFVSRDVLTFW